MIRCMARASGNDLLLHTTTELSAAEEQGAIRKLVANSDVLAAPGALAQVASLEDPTSHKRYQITVTATKPK